MAFPCAIEFVLGNYSPSPPGLGLLVNDADLIFTRKRLAHGSSLVLDRTEDLDEGASIATSQKRISLSGLEVIGISEASGRIRRVTACCAAYHSGAYDFAQIRRIIE